MNSFRRPLTLAATSVLVIAAAGCGTMRSLGQRLFHRGDCDCVTSASVPVGEPVLLPGTMLPPGVVIPAPGAVPVTPPPGTVMKVVPSETGDDEPADSAPLPPVQHPAPPPRRAEPKSEPLAKPEPTVPKPPPLAPPPPPTEARPAGITIGITNDKPLASPGDIVLFTVSARNQGLGAISTLDLTATLSENLAPQRVLPEGSGTIEGRTVVLKTLRDLAGGTSRSFQIETRVLAGSMRSARVTIEAKSPILTAGPVKQESAIVLTPKS